MTRLGVATRPSRSGRSPTNAIKVRTAASASSREGRATGCGACRTCSESGPSWARTLGQGLTTASMTVSVRPALLLGAGGVTGAAASVYHDSRDLPPCAKPGRRIPILHGPAHRRDLGVEHLLA